MNKPVYSRRKHPRNKYGQFVKIIERRPLSQKEQEMIDAFNKRSR